MLKTGEVAKELSVSANTIRDYVNRGYLRCMVTPTGRRLFYEEDIEVLKRNCLERYGMTKM